VFHFHRPYPELADLAPRVGVPPKLLGVVFDPGFAFIFVRASNPEWHLTILGSFAAGFEHSTLYIANGTTPPGGRFSDLPAELLVLRDRIKESLGGMLTTRFSVGVHAGERFLAKLALGLGALLLCPEFVTSRSAQMLRDFMWTRNAAAREGIRFEGSGFRTGALSNMGHLLAWPGGHTLFLVPVGDRLVLGCFFYGRQCAMVTVTDESAHWKEAVPPGGVVYVVSPGIARHTGPVLLGQYIAHRVGSDHVDAGLAEIEQAERGVPALPSYDV
jgi:hypothetical protein